MYLRNQTRVPVTLQPKNGPGYQLHKTLGGLSSWPRCGGLTVIEIRSRTLYQSHHWPSCYQDSITDIWYKASRVSFVLSALPSSLCLLCVGIRRTSPIRSPVSLADPPMVVIMPLGTIRVILTHTWLKTIQRANDWMAGNNKLHIKDVAGIGHCLI